MTDRQGLDARLRALREYLGHLTRLRDMGLRRVSRDPILEGALCRYLQLSIECALDIGELIIAGEGWPRPATNRDVILLLGKKGLLPRSFAEPFSLAAGLRNILVHDYVAVDLGLVFQHLRRLEDFDRFSRYVTRYLKRRRR